MVLASGTKFVDVTGTRLLVQEARLRRALGGGLYFLALNDEPMSASRRYGALVLSRFGEPRHAPSPFQGGHIPLSSTSSPLSVRCICSQGAASPARVSVEVLPVQLDATTTKESS
jgi:hypothetical protein